MNKLPQGWATAGLADLIAHDGVFADGDWVESKDQDPNGSIRLLQLADIGDGVFLDKSNRFINEQKFDQLRCTEVLEGDVLVARMPDPLGRTCLTPRLRQRCITVVDVAIIRPSHQSVQPAWLMHFLNAPEVRQEIEVQSSGTTRRRISRSNLAQLQLPVAPLNEQKRIADKLNTVLARVNACREHLDRMPTILKRFRQAVLAAATSGKLTEEWREGIRSSVEWLHTTVGSLLTDIRYGTAKKCLYEPKKTPVLRIPNILDGRVNHDDMKYAEFEKEEFRKLALAAGDILMIRSNGSLGLVGRTALVTEREEGFVYAGYLIRLRVNQTFARPAYVSIFLTSPGSRDAIEFVARSTSGVNNINAEEIKAMAVSVPGVEEQDEIVRRVESLFTYADRLEARYTAARAQVQRLTSALLAKAFRGELVSQDPNDEPASVLLERIRAGRAASEGAAGSKQRKGNSRPKTR